MENVLDIRDNFLIKINFFIIKGWQLTRRMIGVCVEGLYILLFFWWWVSAHFLFSHSFFFVVRLHQISFSLNCVTQFIFSPFLRSSSPKFLRSASYKKSIISKVWRTYYITTNWSFKCVGYVNDYINPLLINMVLVDVDCWMSRNIMKYNEYDCCTPSEINEIGK
jgi:hypothetical protein